MRNFLIGLIVVSLVIAFGAFAASGFILEKASRQAIGQMMARSQLANMGVASLDYGSVAPSSFSSVTWKNFSVNFYRMVKGAPDVNRSYTIWFDSLTVALDPFTKELSLKGQGIRVRPSNAAADSHTGMDGDFVSIRFFLDELDPISAAKKTEAMLRELVNDIWDNGRTQVEIDFSGTARFNVDDFPHQARVGLEKRGPERLFVMNKTDLRKISAGMREELKQEEIDFISEHPLIAPGL
ncbi:MAG TPA: hypothetical protein VD883_00005, partial [Candidatus Omnitrophota bacterium]|nr:hypothetical protein [Candidatus Omnitrophota bacterium]